MGIEKRVVAASRLPKLTVELAISMVTLEVSRDIWGMNHCRERGIGPLRRKFGKMAAEAPPNDLMEIARDGARVLLANMCAKCPFKECKMKSWDITGRPS